jgi:hypothetical protein
MTETYEEHSRKSGGGDGAQEKDVLRSGDEEEADEVTPQLREEEQLYDDARKSSLVRGSAQQATVAKAASVAADEGDDDGEEATTPPPPAAAEEAEATEEMPTSELPSPLLARREGENESRRDVESLHDHAPMQPSPPCDQNRRAWAASRGGHSDDGVDGREDPSATTNNQMTVPQLANATDDDGLIQQRSENGWRATIHL